MDVIRIRAHHVIITSFSCILAFAIGTRDIRKNFPVSRGLCALSCKRTSSRPLKENKERRGTERFNGEDRGGVFFRWQCVDLRDQRIRRRHVAYPKFQPDCRMLRFFCAPFLSFPSASLCGKNSRANFHSDFSST